MCVCIQMYQVKITIIMQILCFKDITPTAGERRLINGYLSSLTEYIQVTAPPSVTSTLPLTTTASQSRISTRKPVILPYWWHWFRSSRRRRSTSTTSPLVKDTGKIKEDTLLSAMKNENACNPVLKTSATAVVNVVQK